LLNIIKENNVQVVSFQKDTEAIYAKRDQLIKEMCHKYQVEVIERVSHTMYDPDTTLRLNDGLPPNTYEDFKKICKQIGEPIEAIPTPDLKFFSLHLIETNDIYIESEHKVQDIGFFKKKPECKEQIHSVFKGGETQVCNSSLYF
jgi:deoxyribodipyrimidine photolyase